MEPRGIKTTPVYLTENEALQFVKFQKHYAFMGLLESLSVFDIKNGSILIHFNSLGEITGVEKKEFFRV